MLERLIPAIGWARNYKRSDLGGDVTAGLIVAAVLVPHAMACALLAGLPPVMGLYTSFVPLIVYVLLGSSRHLAVGPVALVSLIVLAHVSRLAEPGSEDYIALVLLLSLMVGVCQLALGLLRIGFVVNFLSHAVVSGFTSAAAILIGLSQLKYLLGIPLPRRASILDSVREAVQSIHATHPATLAIGLASIAALAVLRRKAPRFPAALVVVVATTLLAYVFHLRAHGVGVVGDIPRGLRGFALPEVGLDSMAALLPGALAIVFVGFVGSISIARVIAARERYKVRSNQELVALGAANTVGAFFGAYPVMGSFSRTAVNYEAGARTGLASLVAALMIVPVLLVLTPVLYHLPKAVLAAVVMVAVTGLIDVKTPRHLFKIKQSDGWSLVLTFVATLALGVVPGVLLGVALSLLQFIWRSSRPNAVELGYVADEGVYRDVSRFPDAKMRPGILTLRVDSRLYFANMSFLENFIREHLDDKPDTKWLLLDLSGVNDIDGVAIEGLEELAEQYAKRGVGFAFAAMKGAILK